MRCLTRICLVLIGAPVAEWVKRWHTDQAVSSSIPARIAYMYCLSLSSAHRPDMTEIVLKRT